MTVRCGTKVFQYTCAVYTHNLRLGPLSCDFSNAPQVCNVTQVEGGQSVKYSTEVLFSPERFEIV